MKQDQQVQPDPQELPEHQDQQEPPELPEMPEHQARQEQPVLQGKSDSPVQPELQEALETKD